MTDTNPFVGTWKLNSWEVAQPDGTIHYPFGKDVVEYLPCNYSESSYKQKACDIDASLLFIRVTSEGKFTLHFPGMKKPGLHGEPGSPTGTLHSGT